MNFKKLQNVLYYNWIKILAVLFVIVAIWVTVSQCTGKVAIDFGIMYAGESVSAEPLQLLADEISENTALEDTDGDGNVRVNTRSVIIPASQELIIEQKINEQIQFEIISGNNRLYILTKDVADIYTADRNFLPLNDIAKSLNVPDERCLKYGNGDVCAISLSGNRAFANHGLASDGMYIAIRNCPDEQKGMPHTQNALEALEYVLRKQ